MSTSSYTRKPEWLKIQLQSSPSYKEVARSLSSNKLHTVCEEARCPNQHECWAQHKTASFMILGDVCTRRCRFCNVKTGLPLAPDPEEPWRLAASAKEMGLQHVVVTMVNRDDLPDGGAALMAETVRALYEALPEVSVEVLSSDLMGREASILTLLDSKPSIMSHNMETVRRLTPLVRSRSTYDRSLEFLRFCAQNKKTGLVKSSLMLGLGESLEEVLETLDDLRAAGVEVVNLGQYLQPSAKHIPVQEYRSPEDFEYLRTQALKKGFLHVESGPLVRSSYHAKSQYEAWRKRNHPLYKDDPDQ